MELEQDSYDFNCPQYVDFSVADSLTADDKADTWFDFDHENGIPVNGTDSKDVDQELFTTPASDIKRVTRSKSSSSVSTPNAGRPKTPQRATRSKTPKEMKENITPVVNGIKSAPLEKTPSVNNASKKPEIVKETPDNSKDVPSKVLKDKTPKTPQGVVLQDVTDASSSQRITRSVSAKTPQPSVGVAEVNEVKEPKNICTSLEEWKKKTAKQETTHGHEAARQNKTRQAELNSNSKRQHRSIERCDSFPKKSKPVVPERGRTPGKSPHKSTNSGLKRSCSMNVKARPVEVKHARGYSGDRGPRMRSGSASSDKTDHKTEPSKPATPTLLKRKPIKLTNQPAVKNSEQIEMEKIAYFRQELAKKRKQAEESYKAAMSSKGPPTVTQTKELTHPQDFHFQTDSRLKSHPMATRQDEDVKDFASILRSDRHKSPAPSGSKVKGQLTKPQPFAFTHTKRRKLGDLDEKQAEKYETMAEKLKAFTATPDRFRSRPRDKGPQTRGRSRSPSDVTIPKTPNFETKTRSRPVTAPSRQDLENKELEEIQKHQFKAKPVNMKIMTNPNTGIRKVPRKPTTVPEEFHLSTNQRGHEREKPQEDKHEFHAQPLNKRILEGPVGVQEPKKLPVTVPESPAFALKHRARIPVEVPQQEEKTVRRSRTAPHYGIPFRPQLQHKITDPEPFTFDERDRERACKKSQKIEKVYEDEKMEENHTVKAHPAPHAGVPFLPRLTHKSTAVEPFTFDERDKQRLEKKEQKINEILAEERKAREFYANPLPDLENINLPPKKPKPATAPEPFQLDTDIRGSKKAEEWSHKMEDELRQQKEQMRFKARQTHVLEQEPFVPQKPHKVTTDISEFELSTAKRAVKREAFEIIKKVKQDEKDDYLRQEMLRKEAEEREEYERQRREAVHRAQPIKQYKPVNVQRSDKPLTEPMTPDFKTDSRLRSRAQHSETISRSFKC